MTEDQKRRFVEELFSSVRKTVDENLSKTPPHWNGLQLREWIAEKFNQNRFPMDRKDRAAFDQDVVTLNL